MENKMGIIQKLIDKFFNGIIQGKVDATVKALMKDNPGLQKAVNTQLKSVAQLEKEFDIALAKLRAKNKGK